MKRPLPAAVAAILLSSAMLAACSRSAPSPALEPVSLADAQAAGADAGATGTGADASADAPPAAVPAVGGLWVVDADGQPVGVLVQRGHPNLSGASASSSDLLRDGALVYSPKAGVFFGVQMSTGKVISPRLGVTDGSCAVPVVAGYYTEGAFTSGQGYAFVFAGKWWRVKDFTASTLVSCGGTVPDGVEGGCAVHSGSCRGFPVQAFAPPLPLEFPWPMAFSWLSGK